MKPKFLYYQQYTNSQVFFFFSFLSVIHKCEMIKIESEIWPRLAYYFKRINMNSNSTFKVVFFICFKIIETRALFSALWQNFSW